MTSSTSQEQSPRAYFIRQGSVDMTAGVRTSHFVSTDYAGGTWQPEELHMAAVSGLVAFEQEAYEPKDHFIPVRTSFDILGMLHEGEQKVVTKTLRPGRTIELIETTVYSGGRAVLVGRTWRIVSSDTSRVEYLAEEPVAPLEDCSPSTAFNEAWTGGYIASLKSRIAPDHKAGHGHGWMSTDVEVVAGSPLTPWVRLYACIDSINGFATARNPEAEKVFFANVDLSIHLMRHPVGEWFGFRTQQSLGKTGAGLTTATISDVDGPLGRASQALTVREFTQGLANK